VLDWYTVLVGLFTLFALAGHGALYLSWKTRGTVNERTVKSAAKLWLAALVFGILATIATGQVRPTIYANILGRPITWPLVAGLLVCAGLLASNIRHKHELPAFLSSAGILLFMLAATAGGAYPNLLVSTLDPASTLNITNASAGGIGQTVGLFWWIPAMILAVGYFTYLFRSFKGKVGEEADGHGY
jgi:cytochrome d ubiquinol oxidase subunit II